jgi:Xaa-Pro aminopeptidase
LPSIRELPEPRLPARLRTLLDAEFPKFSPAEMQRRRDAFAEAMGEAGVKHLLFSGGDRKGSATQWLTGWPTSNGHFVIHTPGEQDALFVKNPNNAPLARILAPETAVSWGAEGSTKLAMQELAKRGAKGGRVGVIGSYGHSLHERLMKEGMEPVDMGAAYTRMRLVKSAEELDWLRIGCALTDLAVEALERHLAPGLTEHDLSDIIERAYVPFGGINQIHYTGVTSMREPDCCVPSQLARNRKVRAGDVAFTEIAVSFWSYPGQLQRTIALGEPAPLFTELHAVADQAYAAIVGVLRAGAHVEEVLDAASCIARSGFTISDDLLHGYGGGGYLPPVLGTRERPSASVPDFTFAENMTIVVQPSVITKDGRAGVQTGELLLITKTGTERLHSAPEGFRRAASQ